jgi:hypothetical protein
LHHQNAPETGRPGSGGLHDFALDSFQSTDGSGVEFWTYRIDLQRFFSLGYPQRTLASRFFLIKIENRGDRAVPFQRLIANRDPDRLRGYRSARFMDEGMLGFNFDYRWPVFSVSEPDGIGLDSYLFYDTGQVFRDYRDIAWRNFSNSGGFGLRLVGPRNDFVMRVEIGVSREEPVFRLKFSQIFLGERKGLYGGKVPIPAW